MGFTRTALWFFVAGSGFSVLGDATEFFGPRSAGAMSLAGLATLVGLALAFLGINETEHADRRRLTRLAAVAWGVSLVLVGLGTMTFTGAVFVRALGGAVFAAAPVLVVLPLGHRLARATLLVGVAVVASAYVAAALFETFGVPSVGLTLPGDLLLFMGYWMTLRTFRG